MDNASIKYNKKKILTVICVIIGIIVLIIGVSILSKVSKKNSLKNDLKTYLTDECRLEVVNITLTKKLDYFGNFDGYNASVYCNNLSILSYDEMTSIAYYYKLDDIYLYEIIYNGDYYRVSSKDVTKNGTTVYTKAKDDYSHVTLKCDHVWSDWKQDKPCDLFEYIRCTKCNEQKAYRIAEKRHNYDSNGICVDCKEKVYYFEDEVKNIIQIQRCSLGEYNREALIDLKIVWKNTSDKTISETRFSVSAKYKNDTDSMSVKSTVRIAPQETYGSGSHWETLWPSSGMYGLELTHISITYTDGTVVNINEESVKYAFWE